MALGPVRTNEPKLIPDVHTSKRSSLISGFFHDNFVFSEISCWWESTEQMSNDLTCVCVCKRDVADDEYLCPQFTVAILDRYFFSPSLVSQGQWKKESAMMSSLVVCSASLLMWLQSTMTKKENSENQSLTLFSSVRISFLMYERQ